MSKEGQGEIQKKLSERISELYQSWEDNPTSQDWQRQVMFRITRIEVMLEQITGQKIPDQPK